MSDERIQTAKLSEIDFEGPVTRLTFEAPHGTRWTAGEYVIGEAEQPVRTCGQGLTANDRVEIGQIIACAVWHDQDCAAACKKLEPYLRHPEAAKAEQSPRKVCIKGNWLVLGVTGDAEQAPCGDVEAISCSIFFHTIARVHGLTGSEYNALAKVALQAMHPVTPAKEQPPEVFQCEIPVTDDQPIRPAVIGNKRRYLQRLLKQIEEHGDIVEPDAALPQVKAAAIEEALKATCASPSEPVSVVIEDGTLAMAKAWGRQTGVTWRQLAEVCAEVWGLQWK